MTKKPKLPSETQTGPEVGDIAPDFTAEAVNTKGSFEDIQLSKFRGKYVVLLFYPLDFTVNENLYFRVPKETYSQICFFFIVW